MYLLATLRGLELLLLWAVDIKPGHALMHASAFCDAQPNVPGDSARRCGARGASIRVIHQTLNLTLIFLR